MRFAEMARRMRTVYTLGAFARREDHDVQPWLNRDVRARAWPHGHDHRSCTSAWAFDQTPYPDLKGQWRRGPNARPVPAQGQGNIFDPSKGWGPGQEAPLTPEYQARFEANLADQAAGGQGAAKPTPAFRPACRARPTPTCSRNSSSRRTRPTSWSRTSATSRRIFTDGRDWPARIQPTFLGYSIGKWIDTDGDGKYDVLAGRDPRLQGAARL